MITAHQADPTEDLRRERSQASFPSRELAALMAGGEAQLKLRERIADAVRADPVFSKKGKYFMERADLYRTTLEKYLALPRLATAIDPNDPITVGKIIRELIDEPGGLDLHLGMFIPTIQGQGDEEQRKHWLPMCTKLQIIGTYAQTELGHGTYIRGLETTATYDAEKEQFIIHSPTLTATKWWPGGMGKTSTHAVVMARLITHGRDRGPHAFVVQIRRNEDHQTMPGVTAGDIGPKMGYNAVDNGFLRFDHVRVPRRAMLMRYSKVDPDGTFHPPPVAKASYGTMVFVRSDIVMNAALYMKKAVTIAMRYNLVRRQSNPGGEKASGGVGQKGLELQVIDYQHSQRSLFPILARAFAFHCTSDFMRRMYFRYEKVSTQKGDFSALPELHATSSGLKAYCSWATKDAIELCRLCCGGHGFMMLAGFGTTFGNYAPNATYEGDNNVLCLQTARYLLKVARAVAKAAARGGDVRGRRGFGARVPAGQIRRAAGHGGGPWGLCARRPAADPRRGVARGNPRRRCGHVPRHGGLDQGGEGALRVRGAAEFRGRGGGIQAEGELGDGGGDGSARVAPRAGHDGRQHGGFPGGRPRVGGPGGGDPRGGGGAPCRAETRRGGARGLLRAGRLLPQLGVGLARRRRLQEAVRRGSVGAVQRVARAAGVRGLAALAAHQGRRAK